MTGLDETNAAIARALGLDPVDVRRLRIELGAGERPEVWVHAYVWRDAEDDLVEELSHYRLVPVDETP